MSYINYKDAEAILNMHRIIDRINRAVDAFSDATDAYNTAIQDHVAQFATKIVEDLRSEIIATKVLIDKSSNIARAAMGDLGALEDEAKNGGRQI